MTIDLKSLELFVRAAQIGAIGKAGEEVNLSRTASTERIQGLEKAIGVQLFHRTTRTLSLSSEGEIFLMHAKRILENVEDAYSDLQGNPSTVKGELRIASSASFGRMYIAPYLSEFLNNFPGISIQLSLSDTTIDLVNGGFDLSIRLGELAPSSLKARRLAASQRIVVAAPEYINQNGMPASPKELAKHNCLMRGDVRTWKLRDRNGKIADYKVTGNFTSDSAEAITEATISGLGIARKCQWEITEQLKAGQLIQLFDDHTVMPEWSVFAVRSPSDHSPARVRVFSEFLKTKYQSVKSLSF